MSEFAWKDRPADKNRGRAIFGYIVIALTGIVIYWASDNNIFFGLISVVLMFLASGRFYFTSHYYADDIGLGEKFLGSSRTRKWREFKRVDIGRKALFLSPFEKPRRLDSFRGFFVPVEDNDIKEFIIRKVEEGIEEENKEKENLKKCI